MDEWVAPERQDEDRERLESSLAQLAASQSGYFTTAQVLRLGFHVGDVGARIVDGSWQRVERDLFRLAEIPSTDLEEFAKWCTWFGNAAAVSHQSAADLHGLGNLYPRFIHMSTVLSPPAPTRALALHRRSIGTDDCEQIGALRITTPTRTALDLAAGGIAQELLDEVVSDGVAIGRLDPERLYGECATKPAQVAQRLEHALMSCQ
ncbi:hypothetical protein G4H71_15195 [Rhodococcus triatomae]|uniref:Transcriptional regulator, AbiEi antitoxin, Type IV TA system n=1 Tax=Rhodococcus triatomae TaxID=300028 RepID=A0A1G8RPC0_9NOCA|nr:hypothetical protein [Rhodococcus triatomae]QNG19887.1 hypothetical protein G4H72_15180 [Rhodococcus triatomae]QNG24198.1 hypothetical protein G4H71_15195 [Rhodococcus triatomae]SDJ18759.1 Transcriptional regulator, AbiEi antitoxin, Type IV TA system [Rhodococcus triatomae]